MNIPSTWSIDNAVNENKPRSCDAADELACEQDYMRCLLYEGPANDRVAACYCAGQFYGKCLRAAGCAAKQYQNCWKEHQMQDCDDMTVCGSNCVGDGNGLDLSDTRILPINNFARNFLRFSVCDLGVDEDVLERFEVVRMKRCADPGRGVRPGRLHDLPVLDSSLHLYGTGDSEDLYVYPTGVCRFVIQHAFSRISATALCTTSPTC